ncbi:class I SAM-dependent methyltransferase [Haloparvum sp. PAK95]|uniref:class I SAM-dependent methyltransferase n=1 Tax=Haloparvum sp. PAK95 TaxID=3418962 RepID=UPI003D2F081A
MGYHTFDAAKASKLEDAARRYRYVSREELLWALDVSSTETVADFGSGTGFYTDDVAPHVESVHGVDVQPEMHERYREKGLPENVELVESDVSNLPFDDGTLDAAFSTMTYHEFASERALEEIVRVLRPTGRLVVADWSAAGDGEAGPPVDERYDADAVVTALRGVGLEVEFRASRPETFLVVGVLDA